MEILILIAVIATGASGLYVAYTFKTHTERYVAPLIQGARDQVQTVSKDPKKQIQESTGQLDAVTSKEPVTSRELRQQIRTITGELQRDMEAVRQLAERIDARQVQFGRDLLQADHRVTQLGESFDRQGAQLTAIYSYVKSQGQPTPISQKTDQLILAMLEAESHMDRQGWGITPCLYALSEKIQPRPADHEHSAESPDALVLIAQQPLSGNDPVEALTSIRWPEDVVGCVLVAELSHLPARSVEDTPIDPVATGQWTTARPDGRPARLTVAVRRTGEHVCGFRVKGEYDVQVRTEMAAGKIVTALLGTF